MDFQFYIQWVGTLWITSRKRSQRKQTSSKNWTNSNIAEMKRQLLMMGLSIDWALEISTCDENYYKHQQELFIDFYKKGLVTRKEKYVNWDPIENSVLANEQVVNGKGWRSGATLQRKNYFSGFLIFQFFQKNFLRV